MDNSGWIGVDLDGTIAYYDGWRGETHIGKPIPDMVNRVKVWLDKGIIVKIFTARVTEQIDSDGNPEDLSEIVDAIQKWTVEHVGQKLEVTNVKDYGLIELWDDRAVGIDCNTGQVRTHEGWGGE